jgi:hypothetical protein
MSNPLLLPRVASCAAPPPPAPAHTHVHAWQAQINSLASALSAEQQRAQELETEVRHTSAPLLR